MPLVGDYNNVNLLSEENVKKNVLPFYKLENSIVSNIKFKNTDKQRAVYKVENGKDCYCLKKIYFGEADVLFVYSAMEWLYRNEINVPKFLPTVNNERYVFYKNMYFILTIWIEGDKCDYDNIQNILDAVTNLAKMHKSSEHFIPVKGSSNRYSCGNIYTSTKKHFEQILVCSNMAFKYKDKFSKLFLENFQYNIDLAKISLEIASTINEKNLKTSLCHMDYVNRNIIFDKKNNLWVIDFDKCSIDYCAHDIAYFLRRFMKRDLTKWNFEIAISCLKLYSKIFPLTPDEINYIIVYLSFPQKYWKLSRDYYNNINKCNKNSFYSLLSKTCNRDNEQLDFITQIRTYTF